MKKYASINDIVNNDDYPFTQGQMRHFVTNRKTNGLATSIRKIGRKIYIREDLFIEWLESFRDEGRIAVDLSSIDEPISGGVSLPILEITTNTGVSAVEKKTISSMGFSSRTYNALYVTGVHTLEALTKTPKTKLMKARGLGNKAIQEIEDKLNSYGLRLKEE